MYNVVEAHCHVAGSTSRERLMSNLRGSVTAEEGPPRPKRSVHYSICHVNCSLISPSKLIYYVSS